MEIPSESRDLMSREIGINGRTDNWRTDIYCWQRRHIIKPDVKQRLNSTI